MQGDWDLVELGGASECSIDADDAGVGEREVEVGSCGLCFEAQTPLIRLVYPHGYVRIEKRERLLLISLFEIDAGVGGLDIGKAQCASGPNLRCWCNVTLRSFDEDRAEVPFSVGVAHEVEAGLVEFDAPHL